MTLIATLSKRIASRPITTAIAQRMDRADRDDRPRRAGSEKLLSVTRF